MAVAIEVLDDGHLGIATDALNEAFAAARNDDVHIGGHGNQMADSLTVGGLHQLHGIGRQTSILQGLLHQQGQRFVGFNGFRAASQNTSVATFDGQAGRFNGDVGTTFEDHAEHTNGHPHLAHTNAAGLLFHANDFANDIGHGGQLFTAFGAGGQHLGC